MSVYRESEGDFFENILDTVRTHTHNETHTITKLSVCVYVCLCACRLSVTVRAQSSRVVGGRAVCARVERERSKALLHFDLVDIEHLPECVKLEC